MGYGSVRTIVQLAVWPRQVTYASKNPLYFSKEMEMSITIGFSCIKNIKAHISEISNIN
jgi:hypothetical protein